MRAETAFIDDFVGDLLGEEYENRQLVWQPHPDNHPQQMAYDSQADIIGFGGAAGGGKTDLLLGKAFTQFHKAIIFRQHFTDLVDIVTRGDDIMDGRCSFVWGVKRRWNTPDGRQVELGAVEHDHDKTKYRGRSHDGILIDEAVDFTEPTVRFLTGWLRTTDKDQRTQVVLTFNPPMTSEGEWIIRFFAPWLDKKHPNPARPGELRWFIYVNDQDVEVDGPGKVTLDGRDYLPKSRTFIPARLTDNPYISADYINTLDSLPEPLRSQLKYGDFDAAIEADPWQVIPTAWVQAAQERARNGQRPDLKVRAAGCDPARGGRDKTAVAKLYGNWIEIATTPGVRTPDGDAVADFVFTQVDDLLVPLCVDVIGIGAGAMDAIRRLGYRNARPINNSAASSRTDKSRRFGFANIRAESYWRLREALDPASGEDIALPDNREVLADLCSARYKVVGAKYQIEDKETIKARINRSPDVGDAIVLAWHAASGAGRITAFSV